ncbi:MAG: PIN domain-containing protein [Terriglobales bacterium]
MEIARLLARHRLITLDTCVFIYLMERHPKYFHLASAVFERIERRECSAVASTVALTEILVQPYRNANLPQAETFYSLLTTMPNLEWVAPNLQIANSAASLRARYRLQTPDALIAATAIFRGATAVVTNDPIFTRIPSFDTLVLDRLI